MQGFTKGAGDKRRTEELGQKTKSLKKFSSIPDKKHLDDGQVAVVTGTGQLVFRDGGKLYVVTAVEH